MSDLIELGRRAVKCKGWRWLPGMLGFVDLVRSGTPLNHGGPGETWRFVDFDDAEGGLWCNAEGEACCPEIEACKPLPEGAHPLDHAPRMCADWLTPDFSDTLTALGVVALVRERIPNAHAVPMHGGMVWRVRDGRGDDLAFGCSGLTEAEAWVAALEAAESWS